MGLAALTLVSQVTYETHSKLNQAYAQETTSESPELQQEFTVDKIHYKILSNEEGNLTVQVGDGESSLDNKDDTIVIPETVTFQGKDYTVTEIGRKAFAHYADESGAFPTGIGPIATRITLPKTIKKIQKEAFFSTDHLRELILPEDSQLLEIDDKAFHFSAIRSFTLPKTVKRIGVKAFGFAEQLGKFTIPEDAELTTIDTSAFETNKKLKEIYIPQTVTSIGADAFATTLNLAKITVNEGNPNYSSDQGVLFNKDRTILINYPAKKNDISYTTPETVTHIGKSAFARNEIIESIILNENVTEIGDYGFHGAIGLREITLPQNLTSIGRLAFFDVHSLESLDIPDSVTTLGANTIYNAPQLVRISFGENSDNKGRGVLGGHLDSLAEVKIGEHITIGGLGIDSKPNIKYIVVTQEQKDEIISRLGGLAENITLVKDIVTPEDPENPENPDESGSSDSSDSSEGPDESGNPDESGGSEDPEQPTDPEQPVEPVDPTDPEQPVEPVDPTDPEQPEVPVEPVVPVQPEVPVEPVVPVQPEVPVEPVVPVQPEVPVEPVVPVQPEVPVEPVVPVQPAVPAAPAIPVQPVQPQPQTVTTTTNASQTSQNVVPDLDHDSIKYHHDLWNSDKAKQLSTIVKNWGYTIGRNFIEYSPVKNFGFNGEKVFSVVSGNFTNPDYILGDKTITLNWAGDKPSDGINTYHVVGVFSNIEQINNNSTPYIYYFAIYQDKPVILVEVQDGNEDSYHFLEETSFEDLKQDFDNLLSK